MTRSSHCKSFLFTPHRVCGAILEAYESLGGQFGWLMHPIEPEYLNPDGQGYRQRFHNGFIYWHPTTGAHAVTTRNAAVWDRNGWEQGWLGYPTSAEDPVKGSTPQDGERNGWVQHFQGGRMYRTPLVQGAHVASINGLILDKWLSMGGPDSDLGFPMADEAKTADGAGRFSAFQMGSIYWHPHHGAHPVDGGLEALWLASHAEAGEFGYPISSPYLNAQADLVQDFSGRQMKLSDFFDSESSVQVGEHSLDANLAKWVRLTLGVDLLAGLTSSSQRYATFSKTSSWDPPENGTWHAIDGTYRVSSPFRIHPNYLYDTEHPRKTLHDFCTKSPDFWKNQATMVAADLRGPCAAHDMCYETYDSWSIRVRVCDPPLRTNIQTVCRQTFPNGAGVCLRYGDFVYGVVTGVQAGKELIRRM